MQLNIDVSLEYELGPARTALLAIEAAEAEGQTVAESILDIEDASLRRIEGDGGVGHRVWTTFGSQTLRLRYRAKVGVSRSPVHLEGLAATPLPDLPGDKISCLRPSRYCQSDYLASFAEHRFGHLSGGKKIVAIREWILAEMRYLPGHSDSSTTVLETFASRKGVCRDYAHLMCGLARASHIPARYVSAYGARVDPPDFHAVVEVWLEAGWHLVDPSGMCPANELVLIGVGRDAGDVPFMETPDEARFIAQQVSVTSD